MNFALLLCGGQGTRFGNITPKQYYLVNRKPVFMYSTESYQTCCAIDKIIIVAEEKWQNYIYSWILKNNITKFCEFADAGETRQESIVNGLKIINKHKVSDDDLVLIHNSAVPLIDINIIEDCISGIIGFDAAVPAIKVKNEIYSINNEELIDGLTDRTRLVVGQVPETFYLKRLLDICKEYKIKDLNRFRACIELAYTKGLKINIVQGNEALIKITTKEDLDYFQYKLEANHNKQ